MHIDAHVHLQDCIEKNESDGILSRAPMNRIERFFCNGTRPDDWPVVLKMSKDHPQVLPFFGFHPWYVSACNEKTLKELKKYLLSIPSGIGEIGLDKAKTKIDYEMQKKVFAAQICLSSELELPFVVHCVHAWKDCIEAIKKNNTNKTAFIMHYFSGSYEIAQECIRLGGYISFAPRVILNVAKRAQEVIKKMDVRRLLIETDYPYVPKILQDKSHQELLEKTYEKVAEIKGLTVVELEEIISANGTLCADRIINRQ